MGPPLKLTALAEWLLEPPYSGTAFRGWFWSCGFCRAAAEGCAQT